MHIDLTNDMRELGLMLSERGIYITQMGHNSFCRNGGCVMEIRFCKPGLGTDFRRVPSCIMDKYKDAMDMIYRTLYSIFITDETINGKVELEGLCYDYVIRCNNRCTFAPVPDHPLGVLQEYSIQVIRQSGEYGISSIKKDIKLIISQMEKILKENTTIEYHNW